MHQYFILNTTRGIARQLDILAQVIGVYRLDQTDRTDGDQILLTVVVLVILLDDMRDQPKIMLDEDIPRFDISLSRKF